MEEIKLDVQIRNQIGSRKIKDIYRQDHVPGIVYGGKSKSPTAIKVNRRAYERIKRQYKGQSVVFHLNVLEGDKKLRDYSAIVKEEQHDPVFTRLLHIDFHRISLTEKIEVKVQIVIKGEAIGVKQDEGTIEQPLWELSISCLPTNIPEKIEVDISEFKIGDSFHVKDLVLPQGVNTTHDPEAMVVTCVPPKQEEEIEVVEGEEELTEPEVIKEKKEKELGEEEAAEDQPPEEKEKGSEKK